MKRLYEVAQYKLFCSFPSVYYYGCCGLFYTELIRNVIPLARINVEVKNRQKLDPEGK